MPLWSIGSAESFLFFILSSYFQIHGGLLVSFIEGMLPMGQLLSLLRMAMLVQATS